MILILEPSDERWIAFTASKPLANIFHHPAWINLMAECYGYRPFVVAVCEGIAVTVDASDVCCSMASRERLFLVVDMADDARPVQSERLGALRCARRFVARILLQQ